jgi:hypothetical protein
LDMALIVAFQHSSSKVDDVNARINYWPLSIAIRDLRKALGAFQRRAPMEPADFPDTETLLRLSRIGGRDVGLEGVGDWLMEKGVA